MAWASVTTLEVNANWQYTEPVTGRFFRLKHTGFRLDDAYAITQIEVATDGSIALMDEWRELKPAFEPQIVELVSLPIYTERRIAIKRLPKPVGIEAELRRVLRNALLEEAEPQIIAPRRSNWQVEVEVSDYVEPVATGSTTGSNNGGTTTTDPYFANVVLLTRFDGANNSATFTDAKGKSILANGNVKIDTTQSKFGGASAYFDGSGDYLRLDNSDDFHFGSGDFTIECWLRLEATESRDRTVLAKISPDQNAFMLNIGSDSKISFSVQGYAGIVSTTMLAPSSWYHVAISRNSGTVRLFLNGILEASGNIPSSPQYNNPVYIGAFDPSNAPFAFWYRGWNDDLRITKDIGRYTTDFTVPAKASPNS